MIDEEEYRRLKAEVQRLRADMDGLKAFVRHESDDVTKHILLVQKDISKISRHLTDAFGYIWPMVEKVLPDFVRDRKRIEEVMRGKKS